MAVGPPLIAAILGVPLAAVVLVVTAFATGWFAGAPPAASATSLPGLTVQVPASRPPVRDLASATGEDAAERDRLTNALAARTAAVHDRCHLADALVADVLISDLGRVRTVDVKTPLDDEVRRCLVRGLRDARLARTTSGDVKMRISVSF